jgi:serine/threonine-protein kinase HipA
MAPPRLTELDVYLGNHLVGHLVRPGSGRLAFQYTDELAATQAGDIVLSVSLPVQQDRFPNGRTRPFFEGLLPEGTIRRQIARERGLSEDNAFGLLGEIGAECAGAVVIVPSGEQPVTGVLGSVRWLMRPELEAALAALPQHPLGVGNDVRLSLGGLQQKLIVIRTPDGRVGQPLNGAPSTHIIKPSLPGYEDIAANEAFCLRLAQCAGLTTARATVEQIGETSCLLIERFDRTLTDDLRVERLHQEDFCQALGVLPSAKYEVEGGPSILAVIEALRMVSSRAAADVTAFVRTVAFNFLIGNADAHGKNFGLLYDRDEGPKLAPLYDLVCTDVYDVTARFAMYIAGEDEPEKITRGSWQALARECGLNPTLLVPDLEKLTDKVIECADAVSLQAVAEGWHRPIIDEVIAVIRRRALQI